jgi:hypothetical protein
VVLLDISQSMNEFVTREEDGQEDDDGASSDDESSSDDEEDDDEGSDAMDTEEEGEQSMRPFPDATEIHCPPELMCPLTHGILLDPVSLCPARAVWSDRPQDVLDAYGIIEFKDTDHVCTAGHCE